MTTKRSQRTFFISMLYYHKDINKGAFFEMISILLLILLLLFVYIVKINKKNLTISSFFYFGSLLALLITSKLYIKSELDYPFNSTLYLCYSYMSLLLLIILTYIFLTKKKYGRMFTLIIVSIPFLRSMFVLTVDKDIIESVLNYDHCNAFYFWILTLLYFIVQWYFRKDK